MSKDDSDNGRSKLERFSECNSAYTPSGDVPRDCSRDISPSLDVRSASCSSKVPTESGKSLVIHLPWVHRTYNRSSATFFSSPSLMPTDQSSLQPNPQVLVTGPGSINEERDNALGHDKVNAENDSSWLSSVANLAVPDIVRSQFAPDTTVGLILLPSVQSFLSDLPSMHSSSNTIRKDLSWESSTRSSTDNISNSRDRPKEVGRTGNGPLIPSGRQTKNAYGPRGTFTGVLYSSEISPPGLGSSELVPNGSQASRSQLSRGLSLDPWPLPGARSLDRKRKRSAPNIESPSTLEDNNIPFVLPPIKKNSRRNPRNEIVNPNKLSMNRISVPLAMLPDLPPVPKEHAKLHLQKRMEKGASNRAGMPIKIVSFEGELLSTEIIMNMLNLTYYAESDCLLPCKFPQCSDSISRRDVLSHCNAHLLRLGYKNGEAIPCDICPEPTKRYSSLHALSRHIRDGHFKALEVQCGSCDREIKRGTSEVIRRHLYSNAHRDLWNGLGLRWEYRHRREISQCLLGSNQPKDVMNEENGEELQEASSTGRKRRKRG